MLRPSELHCSRKSTIPPFVGFSTSQVLTPLHCSENIGTLCFIFISTHRPKPACRLPSSPDLHSKWTNNAFHSSLFRSLLHLRFDGGRHTFSVALDLQDGLQFSSFLGDLRRAPTTTIVSSPRECTHNNQRHQIIALVVEVLRVLVGHQLLFQEEGVWCWNMDDSGLELGTLKMINMTIQQLSNECHNIQTSLSVAACLGRDFDGSAGGPYSHFRSP